MGQVKMGRHRVTHGSAFGSLIMVKLSQSIDLRCAEPGDLSFFDPYQDLG